MRRKAYKDANVWEAAKERVRYLYKRFDRLVVSFSGGKDSTSVLHVTLTVAKELNKLPVKVLFIDEEAIDPETIAYVDRVRQRPDVSMDWYCLPVKHRNACSLTHPHWYCWHPDEKHLWVRDIPEWAITSHPAFEWGMDYQTWCKFMFPPSEGTTCVLTGIRTQESLRRYQVIASKRNDSYITASADNKATYRAHPIYDWSTEDVWTLIHKYGFDYNKAYDVFNRTNLHGKLLAQRICQPFGEEPLRGLDLYATCFPEMWSKLVLRVPGVQSAYRYANTELYKNSDKPDGMTWEDFCWHSIERQKDIETRDAVRDRIKRVILRHTKKTPDPIHEVVPHPVSGCSWKFLARLAARGDLKGRGEAAILNEALKRCSQLGITPEQAIAQYGYNRTAHQPGSVGTPGHVAAQPLQPQRGSTTGTESAGAVNTPGRMDATHRGLQPSDSGRIPSVDSERTSSGVSHDWRPGPGGGTSGRGFVQAHGFHSAAQPSAGSSRSAADGRHSGGDVQSRDGLKADSIPHGDGSGRSSKAGRSERNSSE